MSTTEKVDKKAQREARKKQKRLKNAAVALRRKMINYSRDERFARALAAAVPLYWNDFYTIESADEMDQNESLRFFDWFFFDYQPADEPRLIERFYEEEAGNLDENQREVLEGWRDAPPASAFEYVDFDAYTNRFKLRDFFTDEEFTAISTAGSGYAQKGDLILTRLVPVGEELIFSTVGAFIPEDEIADLADKIAAAKENFLKENPDASDADFLRANNNLIIHHALSMSVENDRFAVTRLDPTRVDKAVKRQVKKTVKKLRKGRKK